MVRARGDAEITVEVRGAEERLVRLAVRVREGTSETQHEVTVRKDWLAGVARPGETVETFVRRSFAFLLEREPKESILGRFDVSVIAQYFPEYERTIGDGRHDTAGASASSNARANAKQKPGG